ncbi:outer membrane autotransporter barrel domain protein [Mesorhizobium alhagi CCNWXJ12-2]|uniref:Outer membrane autotransporter barrel domain protein n=1 Tax=Mesorhizobium alhagi CCNWXJ12-2 TaxID=1107882 RepID=H0I1K0_9HYPH|nr:outer membrane autotransporter barrel domain protein [Mesorhizobium alhagi CCNWXJ12-2]
MLMVGPELPGRRACASSNNALRFKPRPLSNLAGASGLAIAAAVVFSPSQTLACTATPVVIEGIVQNVVVDCNSEDTAEAFATSFDATLDDGSESGFSVEYDGNGADAINIMGGQIVQGQDGAEFVNPPAIAGTTEPYFLDERDNVIETLGGDDAFTMNDGIVGAAEAPVSVFLGTGNDRFTIDGGTIYGSIFGEEGNDTFDVGGTGTINEQIYGGAGNDVVTVSGEGAVIGSTAEPDAIGLEGGDDRFTMTGGTVGAAVSGGDGNDRLTVAGGTIAGFLAGNSGDDIIRISGGTITGFVLGEDGIDTITVEGGTLTAGARGGLGNDVFNFSGGTAAAIYGDGDDDTVTISGGDIGLVSGGDGNDAISIGGVAAVAAVSAGAGNDTTTLSADAAIAGSVALEAGDDTFNMTGGTIGGDVTGGEGVDTVTIRDGTIAGGINAETVNLRGGSIGGDIGGLSGNTLTIEDLAPLDLRDGVIFSGVGAAGTISGVDLAGGGESQNFIGFSSLGLTGSTLRFIGATQVIDALTLRNASTLFSNGATTLGSQDGGFGNLSVVGSTLTMINGDPTDTLTLGGLTLDNATIGIDVDQVGSRADRIAANGAVTAMGNNIILVNLIGAPELVQTTQIPILTAAGAPIGGTFDVSGITGTPAALFNYQVVEGPGGLFLLASPNDEVVGAVAAVDAAAAAQTVNTFLDAVFDITGDAAEYGLGLAGGAPVAAAPTFGIFASGQFAQVDHDGFTISSGAANIAGPSFSSEDFSAALSLDFNAAKHFGFDAEYGLNIGVFGGYTSTDVGMGSFGGFNFTGEAQNESGMAGAYVLFRREVNYVLVSGTALFGNTDVQNGILGGAAGEYDTVGYAVTASAGRIFALSDRMRFDLRGGILGVSFTGDSYTDNLGVAHGETEVSFGALKFEPGVYGDFQWQNGMVFSPYLRGELQQRFAYENTAIADGRSFEFDDSDFSAAVMAGFNLKVMQSATVSAEVRGKASSDSTTLAGKVGLKVAF